MTGGWQVKSDGTKGECERPVITEIVPMEPVEAAARLITRTNTGGSASDGITVRGAMAAGLLGIGGARESGAAGDPPARV